MDKYSLSFEGIVEFVTVADAKGFSEAARRLKCSVSHVSRQVSRLEQRLGTALFARSTRSVNLTENGRQYYLQCQELVSGLSQANETVTGAQSDLQGTLRISMAGSFAEQFVAPALVAFAKLHPQLSVELDFSTRRVNFVEDGFDFAIRYGRLQDSGLVARKLADRNLMAVASPDYLKENGEPTEPEALVKHSCLITNNDTWLFERDGKEEPVKVSGRFRSNNANAIVDACRAGLGIGYMPKSSFQNAVTEGSLIPILEPFWTQNITSWVVYQNRRFLPLKARLAIDYLLEHFKDWNE
ncbi:LysR family transcriptional regulator [Enterovibrio paralichthyis]|uniref:LysR family transcriptional regulator n=1 Tax=Enterovibrio paralichthyis TaxID=2853805 RepID=UPI001C451699|nr:LysR family transcriptional regulator [Enterovibrio paralichthyis]MBV7299714.1 LysR family transcriptional regulator [Enterovibrio paralichthyis]